MVTGYEVQMYADLAALRRAAERIADALDRAFPVEDADEG